MRRRDFLSLVGIATAARPLKAKAQQSVLPVAGFLSPIAQANAQLFLEAHRQGLAEMGFVEGRNIKIEYRWAEGQYDRLPSLAAELVKMRVAVITTMGDAAYAAKDAQRAGDPNPIPIVFGLGDDPVATGLVASLNRPGGHITGATSFGHGLGPKKFELLRELVPTAKTFGLLINPKQAGTMEARDIEQAASTLGVKIRILHARNATEIDEAFATIARERIDGMIVSVDTLFLRGEREIGSVGGPTRNSSHWVHQAVSRRWRVDEFQRQRSGGAASCRALFGPHPPGRKARRSARPSANKV